MYYLWGCFHFTRDHVGPSWYCAVVFFLDHWLCQDAGSHKDQDWVSIGVAPNHGFHGDFMVIEWKTIGKP